MQRIFKRVRCVAQRFAEGRACQRRIAGLHQRNAERVPCFGATRSDAAAAQQQGLRLGRGTARDQQASKCDQRFLAARVQIEHAAIGSFRAGVVTVGP